MIARVLISLISLLMLSGCVGAKRALYTAGGAALGGGVSYAVFDKNPLATGIGAAAGAILTNSVLGEDETVLAESYKEGYLKGSSDSIKRQYWLKNAMEEGSSNHARMAYYSIPGKTQGADGRMLVDHSVTVPILE